jgi:hypothetical protein
MKANNRMFFFRLRLLENKINQVIENKKAKEPTELV